MEIIVFICSRVTETQWKTGNNNVTFLTAAKLLNTRLYVGSLVSLYHEHEEESNITETITSNNSEGFS